MKSEVKIKATKLLYFGFSIYIYSCIFIESEIHNISGMDLILRFTKYFGIMLCIASRYEDLKVKEKTVRQILVMMFLVTINMLFVDGGIGLLELLVIVFCFIQNQDSIKGAFDCEIKGLLVGHLFVMFLSMIGVIQDNVSSRWFGNYMGSFFAGEYVRHQLGFLTSNQIPLTLMIVYTFVIATKQKRVKTIEHIFFLIANYWCFINFGARVSFILIIVAFIWYETIRLFSPKRCFKHKPYMWLSYPGCAAISLVSAYLYNPNSRIWIVLNEIFYNRLRWSHAALIRYGIPLIGCGINAGKATGADGENLVDNAYVLTVVQKGVIIAIIMIFLLSYLTYRAEKANNRYLVLSLVVIAAACLIDDHLSSYKIIPFYVLAFSDVYNVINTRRAFKNARIKNGAFSNNILKGKIYD